MITNPTPGPWFVEAGRFPGEPVVACKNYQIAKVLAQPDRGEAHANAYLIAAAPELLAAVRVAAEMVDQMHAVFEAPGGYGYSTKKETLFALYQQRPLFAAAIAKATGEEQAT